MADPKDIVILSIGPVQSYVSAARRTQDLRTASQALSLLSQAAISMAGSLDCEVIYPQNRSLFEGVPNRMVLLAPVSQGASTAKQIYETIETTRNMLSSRVQRYFESKLGGATYDSALWTAQVKDWLEVYWVTVPWDGEEDTYKQRFGEAGLGLDGRKSLRGYPKAVEKNETCSLCGIRSTLGGKDFWNRLNIPKRLIRPQERLCAVCTIKRILPVLPASPLPSEGFLSTASIASASYRSEIERFSGDAIIDANGKILKGIILKLGLDFNGEGALYYPDFYQESRIKKETDIDPDPIDLEAARTALFEINKRLVDIGASNPHANPYYAILLMDGDHMGKLLDGVRKRNDHVKISQALSELSDLSKGIVENKHGQVVFSGGDDLLALLPVNSVLTAAEMIQSAFRKKLEEKGFPGMSMSAGVAVAHYSAPMQNTIRTAREAENVAKTVCDRDALVLHVAKRSGEIRHVAVKWRSSAGLSTPLDQIEELINGIADENVSGKLAYDVWEEMHAMADATDNPSSSLFQMELYRLLKRHSSSGWKSSLELKKLAERLSGLWDFMPFEASSKVEQIAQWLLVARFLAQGEQL